MSETHSSTLSDEETVMTCTLCTKINSDYILNLWSHISLALIS